MIIGKFLRLSATLICLAFLETQLQAQDQDKLERHCMPYSKSKLELMRDIDYAINDPRFHRASIGICVKSLTKGEILYVSQEDKNLIPASNTKMFTVAAAFDVLGSHFEYETGLFLDGELKDEGIFEGNVVVVGSGDPTMSTHFHEDPTQIFEKWAQAIALKGIKVIKGSLIGDDSAFDRIYWGPQWAWDDIHLWYSPAVSALSFQDSTISLTVSGCEAGSAPQASFYPLTSSIAFENRAITVESDDRPDELTVAFDENGKKLLLKGMIVQGKTEVLRCVFPHPTEFFIHLFKEALQREGIKICGDAIPLNNPYDTSKAKQIDFYRSPPLAKIAAVIQKKSHNLCAEMLLKTMAKKALNSKGSFAGGCQVVKEALTKMGVDLAPIKLLDGSGLSRKNALSAATVVQLLETVYASRNGLLFMETLAGPGEDGTLSSRFEDFPERQLFKAKTGGLEGVCCLSGYLETLEGDLLAFSILVNQHQLSYEEAAGLIDRICLRLANFRWY